MRADVACSMTSAPVPRPFPLPCPCRSHSWNPPSCPSQGHFFALLRPGQVSHAPAPFLVALPVVQNCHLCLLVISLSSQNVSCTRGGGGASFVCLVTDVSPAPRTQQAPSSTSANVLIHWMKEQMNVHRTKKYLYGATAGLL